jgi:D-3-phosphoglycerate dehydrogenase
VLPSGVDTGGSIVADPVHSLILDLLEWIAPRPRSYAEVIDAWRTSCPRLPVWEEAADREYVEVHEGDRGSLVVRLTSRGREFLDLHRGAARPAR